VNPNSLLRTGVAPYVKVAMSSFLWQHFPQTLPTFREFPDIFLAAVKFLNILRFSSQVVTLYSLQCSQLKNKKQSQQATEATGTFNTESYYHNFAIYGRPM